MDRIRAARPAFSDEGLSYLYRSEIIREYQYRTQAHDSERRMDYLVDEVIHRGHPDLLEGERYLVLVMTSPEYQLLMKELPAIGIIVEHLQDHGAVSFDFGIKDGLGKELEVLIVRSK